MASKSDVEIDEFLKRRGKYITATAALPLATFYSSDPEEVAKALDVIHAKLAEAPEYRRVVLSQGEDPQVVWETIAADAQKVYQNLKLPGYPKIEIKKPVRGDEALVSELQETVRRRNEEIFQLRTELTEAHETAVQYEGKWRKVANEYSDAQSEWVKEKSRSIAEIRTKERATEEAKAEARNIARILKESSGVDYDLSSLD